MGLEKNGIVGLDDIFKMGPVDEVYNREEDILPIGDKDDPVKEEPIKAGSKIDEDPVVKNEPEPKREEGEDLKKKDEEKVVIEQPVVNYKKILDTLSSRGVIPDLKDVVFSGDNGEEISISDLDFSKEDSLCDVIETIIESQKEDIVKDKIDVGSVSEITRKLIKADKAGANIVDILKQYDTTTAPIENLNIEDKADQIKIIRHYVDLLGLPKEEADEFYKGIINKGDEYVEAKAIKYKSELDKKMDEIIQERMKAAEEKRAKDAEDFKRYKKELKSSFQTKYQLNDNMVSKALDFALKSLDGKPGVTRVIERVREMMQNPEEAPDLVMFLMNPGEFIKQKSNSAIVDEKKKIYKLVSRTSKDRRSAPVDDKGDQVSGLKFDEITLD